MEENMSIKEQLDFLMAERLKAELPKSRPIKVPRKAKVSKSKIKKGFVGLIRIDENGNISGEKVKIADRTIKLKDGTYHATNGEEVLFWDGKFPVIIQPSWKSNPLKVKRGEDEVNETYGQKYIMARMLGDTIKVKAKGALPLLYIVGAAIAGYVIYSLFTGG